ncbi:MAG: SAF domain-containing protein [Clostridia bacterium]
MAMNPMQRKANNYLLIGVLVTLLITGTIIGFLFIQLNKLQTERKTETSAMKEVFVVSTDINSGDTVSLDKLKKQSVASSMIPSNALTVGDITENTIAKIAVKKGSVITTDMVAESDAQTTDDVRVQEYNMVLLPTQIQTGDYVDIRLRMPTGEDFIVVSKKRVELPMIDGVDSYSSIKLQMSEEDTVVMSNAIVEAYIMKGSVLYAATYVEPGMQNGATTTYVPKATVQDLMYRNPNIVTEAKNALMTIYNANQSTRNNVINGGLSQYREEELDNIQEAVQEQINKAKEERQNYLESLGATY